ncbi:hypothetical protein PVAP13_6KG246112 [Panicum virgatum]|uniref:Uncharacterized protein n=1 Tax=Panicum virgatum TaxID=38727 RepID=A0A8T0RFJ5_PANVG|nr:hypothetical protein PVAP13_6KG246112 [Panicum virgatum]
MSPLNLWSASSYYVSVHGLSVYALQDFYHFPTSFSKVTNGF